MGQQRRRRGMFEGGIKDEESAKTHWPDTDMAGNAWVPSSAVCGNQRRGHHHHRPLQTLKVVGWDALLMAGKVDADFDFFSKQTPEDLPKKERRVRKKEKTRSRDKPCRHVWKPEPRVHNKGKGKYQWYACALCKGRQKRNCNKKSKKKVIK